MTSNDLAYAAGFIDGEGSITIVSQRQHDSFYALLSVVNTNLGVLSWLKWSFGVGSIQRRPKRKHQQRAYDWVVSAREAQSVLSAIYPHLKVKVEQTRLVLDFIQTLQPLGGTHRLTPEVKKYRKELFRKVRALHHKQGKSHPKGAK